ncbi:MAG: hypothetical protein EHM72_12980, partial [Calditrichaeota bacterium]
MADEIHVKNFENLRSGQFDALLQISRLLNSAYYEDNLIDEALGLAIQVLNAERGLFAKRVGESEFVILSARNLAQENISDLS